MAWVVYHEINLRAGECLWINAYHGVVFALQQGVSLILTPPLQTTSVDNFKTSLSG